MSSSIPLQATLLLEVCVGPRLADGDGSQGEILPSLLPPAFTMRDCQVSKKCIPSGGIIHVVPFLIPPIALAEFFLC